MNLNKVNSVPRGVDTFWGDKGGGMQAFRLVSLPHPSMVVGNQLESRSEST